MVRSPLTAASATFALKAGEWFRRGRLLMVSPVHGDYRRYQAEIPLIVLSRFPRPALFSNPSPTPLALPASSSSLRPTGETKSWAFNKVITRSEMAWVSMYTQSQRRLAMTRQSIPTNNQPDTAVGKAGYKHPPVKNQFRKGQSGNPRGRRKGQRNLAPVLAEVLSQTVTVRQQGKAQRMSKGEALIKILLAMAQRGDGR